MNRKEQSQQQAREEQGQQQAREEHGQRQAREAPKDCDRDWARYEDKCAVQSKAAAIHPTSDAGVQQQSIQSASQTPDVQQGQYELKLDEEITTIPKRENHPDSSKAEIQRKSRRP